MNDTQRRKKQINTVNDRPRKRQCRREQDANESSQDDHFISMDATNNTEPQSKPAKKPKCTTKLANKWIWRDHRVQKACKMAVTHKLFAKRVEQQQRDKEMRLIVSDINKCTEEDVNYALLTYEKYRKKIYELQRKLCRFPKEATELLPEYEQELFKHLDECGLIQEAATVKLKADTSLVA